jgi:hypothetical protein
VPLLDLYTTGVSERCKTTRSPENQGLGIRSRGKLKYNGLQTRVVVSDESAQKRKQNHGKLLIDKSKKLVVIGCLRV